MLRGATLLLNQIDVLALRVQLHPGAVPDAGLSITQAWLEDHGFVLCGVESERNPKLGTALFVRNFRAVYKTTKLERDELARVQCELQTKLASITEARQAEATANVEVQQQRDELARTLFGLQAQMVSASRSTPT